MYRFRIMTAPGQIGPARDRDPLLEEAPGQYGSGPDALPQADQSAARATWAALVQANDALIRASAPYRTSPLPPAQPSTSIGMLSGPGQPFAPLPGEYPAPSPSAFGGLLSPLAPPASPAAASFAPHVGASAPNGRTGVTPLLELTGDRGATDGTTPMPAPVRAYGRTAQGQPDFQSAVSPAGFSDGQQPVGADRQSQSDLAQAPAAPTTPANQTRISIQPPAVKSVTAKGQSVEITFDDGTIETRRGGSRTWRTNNPEAIEYGDVARRHGAVGHDGRFAIFPNEEAGKRAAIAILKSSKYQAKTIGEAIASWAPPQENNTAAYQRFVEHLTGLNGSTPMHSLTQSQLDRVYEAIKRFEGWLPGPPRARP